MIFVFVQDGRFDGSDWAVMFLVTMGLIASVWALKTYFPQIFSSFPQETQNLFSSFIK